MKVLELFCGTKSFSKALKKKYPGAKVITVDMNPKFSPDILTDVLKWDYKKLKFKPDFIWASPPCTEWSLAKTTAPRNLPLARKIVRKTFEIINHFDPPKWVIENPVALLSKDIVMKGVPAKLHRVDYCMYGDHSLKPTHLWCHGFEFPAKTCQGGRCKNGRIDPQTGQFNHTWRMGARKHDDWQKFRPRGETAYPIPPKLCLDIIKNVFK